jgi:predicted nucleic-acid-binding Zn-ribbon protein
MKMIERISSASENRINEVGRMKATEEALANAFVCVKCGQHEGHVEKLALSGTGISRLLEIQPYRYAYVSCGHCGYTEVYNMQTLEGKDNLGDILDVIFMD